MSECKPLQMRKNLEMVQDLKNSRIDFMPIPVRDEKHRLMLAQYAANVLEEMAIAAEQREGVHSHGTR